MKAHVRARPKFNNIRRSGNRTLQRACSAKQITFLSSRFNGYCLSDFRFRAYVPHIASHSDDNVLYLLTLSFFFFTFFLYPKIKNVRTRKLIDTVLSDFAISCEFIFSPFVTIKILGEKPHSNTENYSLTQPTTVQNFR